jgi:hypothetical protein
MKDEGKNLIKQIAARQKRVARLRYAGFPEVGIIFDINGKLFIDSTPYTEAEDYGDFVNHPYDHERYFRSLRGILPDLRGVDYDFFPRGRAVYNKKTRTFYLYLDRCLMPRKSEVMELMHLPYEKTIVSRDIHYQCNVCEYD